MIALLFLIKSSKIFDFFQILSEIKVFISSNFEKLLMEKMLMVFSSSKSLVLIRQVKCMLSENFCAEEETQSDKCVCSPSYTMKSRKHFQRGKHQWVVLDPRVFIPLSAFRRVPFRFGSILLTLAGTLNSFRRKFFRKPPWGESGSRNTLWLDI